MNVRNVALRIVMMVVAGGVVAFGFAGAAYSAPISPSISTSQQPASTTVGSSIADKATVTSGGFTCPSQDEAGFSLGESNTSTNPIFCSYPAFAGEDPNDFYCTYDASSGALVMDHDAGFCPATAVGSGGASPTGTVTFNLYNNATGSGTPLFTDTESLSGGSVTSASYTTTAAGTDYWVATYNGDSNNSSVSSGNGDEPVVVGAASPSISTSQQPASAMVGASIADKATVSAGVSPTGTVTFNLYNNATGSGTPLFTDTESLSGGSATSASYTTTAAGTDYWVATYNGDSNNKSVSSGNGDEPVVVGAASPSISTSQQPASAMVGASIADKATVSGGVSPTGTVTFNLYNNATGSGTPLFTDTESLSGGSATSASYTTTAAGTDYWVATYNGDSNNKSVSSGNGDEPVVVGAASPSISTSQQPASAMVGAPIADKATVSRRGQPDRDDDVQPLQQLEGQRHPLVDIRKRRLVGARPRLAT